VLWEGNAPELGTGFQEVSFDYKPKEIVNSETQNFIDNYSDRYNIKTIQTYSHPGDHGSTNLHDAILQIYEDGGADQLIILAHQGEGGAMMFGYEPDNIPEIVGLANKTYMEKHNTPPPSITKSNILFGGCNQGACAIPARDFNDATLSNPSNPWGSAEEVVQGFQTKHGGESPYNRVASFGSAAGREFRPYTSEWLSAAFNANVVTTPHAWTGFRKNRDTVEQAMFGHLGNTYEGIDDDVNAFNIPTSYQIDPIEAIDVISGYAGTKKPNKPSSNYLSNISYHLENLILRGNPESGRSAWSVIPGGTIKEEDFDEALANPAWLAEHWDRLQSTGFYDEIWGRFKGVNPQEELITRPPGTEEDLTEDDVINQELRYMNLPGIPRVQK
jgi:hypothetical protein